MFNDEKIEKLEDRVKKLEYIVDVYTETGVMPISTVLYLLLRHLKLRIITTEPITKFEEINDDKA